MEVSLSAVGTQILDDVVGLEAEGQRSLVPEELETWGSAWDEWS